MDLAAALAREEAGAGIGAGTGCKARSRAAKQRSIISSSRMTMRLGLAACMRSAGSSRQLL